MSEELKVTVVEFNDRPHFQMQWRDPRTGKKKTKSTGILRTGRKGARTEAEKIAGQHEEKLQAGDYRESSKLTWEQFRERYDREVMQSLALGTRQKIDGVFDSVEETIHPQRLRDVTDQKLSAYQGELRGRKLSEDTIRGHLAHLGAALRWAARLGLLPKAPHIDMPRRAKGSCMKGRPINGEEFDRLLAAVPGVLYPKRPTRREPAASKRVAGQVAVLAYWGLVGSIADGKTDDSSGEFVELRESIHRSQDQLAIDVAEARQTIESWRHYLRGMWFSGLRLEESLALYWDRSDRLCIDLDGEHPMLRIPAELEKGNQDRHLPLSPEFATFLLATPEAERTGPVFQPRGHRVHGARLTGSRVGVMVRKIGKAAGVKVHIHPTSGAVKFASVHDLRRSFGERWAGRVMPQTLMELMRHESIETTMKYYIGRNAQRTAKTLWEAHHRAEAGEGSSNTSGNSQYQRGVNQENASVATPYPNRS